MQALKWSTAIDIEISRLDRTQHERSRRHGSYTTQASWPDPGQPPPPQTTHHTIHNTGILAGSRAAKGTGGRPYQRGDWQIKKRTKSSRPAIIPGQAWKSLRAPAGGKEEPSLGYPAMHEAVPEMPDPEKGPQNQGWARAQQPEQAPQQRGRRQQAQARHQQRGGRQKRRMQTLPAH
jgi:hypothetical protein